MPSPALKVVKHFEGWEPRAYDDPAGYCTIGYGHLIARDVCGNLQLPAQFRSEMSEADGATLLTADTALARAAVEELVTVDLSDAQFGALSAFVFNVGKDNFRRSTMRELINLGQTELAAPEFRRWVRAGGVVMNGLVIRRTCEEALFAGRIELTEDQVFDRSMCVTLGAADEAGPPIDIEVGEIQ